MIDKQFYQEHSIPTSGKLILTRMHRPGRMLKVYHAGSRTKNQYFASTASA